tara:strand:+ start:4030 stop:4233 length:204 start_codon:yes stop_codon:yes gene_type:complete
MTYSFFKELGSEEEAEFRKWAQENYVIGDPISSSWHPVVVDECMTMLMGKSKGKSNGVDLKEQPPMG